MRTRLLRSFVVLIAAVTLGLNVRAQQRVEPQRPLPTARPETPRGSDASNASGLSAAPAPGNSGVAPTAGNGPTMANPPDPNALVIGAGDLLEIAVYGAPDFDKFVRVADSGEVSLPLLGVVRLGGMSPPQAEQLLQKRLSDGAFFTNPQVSVFVKEYATQGVSVLGEVQKPGIYPLLGPRTVLDAISAAGGTTPTAGETVTVAHRSDPTRPLTVKYTAEGGATPILPGDTVMVSKAGLIYVVGDVKMPGGFVSQNTHMTVLQALAMAQGANPTAALNRAKVVRQSASGPTEIPIKLGSILSSKEPDLQLKPDDILFVPSSAAKSAGRRTLDAIVQTATGVAIYRR